MATKKPFKLPNYKTYDTSEGFGNPDEWKTIFSQRMGKKEAEEILSSNPGSPHEILEVKLGASFDEIKKAYRKLILKWHPDKNNGSAESAKMTRSIVAAYTILTEK